MSASQLSLTPIASRYRDVVSYGIHFVHSKLTSLYLSPLPWARDTATHLRFSHCLVPLNEREEKFE